MVTRMGNGSISLAHNGTIPLWMAASGKPPIPSKRLPIGFSFIGTLSDLTFCMGMQWREPLHACSFFCFDFL